MCSSDLSAVATALAAHEAGEAPQIAPDEVARVLHRALEGAEAGR